MSILIRGMKMPEKCCDCWFANDEEEWCSAMSGKYLDCDYRYGINERPSWCPLVEVPTPHGDLIERKATYLTYLEISMCDGNYKDGMTMLLEKIDSAPIIIPAEEG